MTKTKQRAVTAKALKDKGMDAPAPKDPTQAFLREVDDAIQQERLLHFWQVWKVAIIGGVVSVLLLVAGWQLWQEHKTNRLQDIANAWDAAQRMEDGDARHAALRELLDNSHGGYRALAAFGLADAEEDVHAADTLYAEVYEDGSQPKWLRDLARFNAAMRLLTVDDGKAQRHFGLLAQYNAGEPIGAAAASALEQLAWMAVRNNDIAGAKGHAQRLLGLPNISPDMRQRASQVLAL